MKSSSLDRPDINEESTCFFIVNDHKENFQNNATVRLINPTKNKVGRISEVILDSIKSSLIKHTTIKETLLIKAIKFAKKKVNITKEDIVITKHARKSHLYDNN